MTAKGVPHPLLRSPVLPALVLYSALALPASACDLPVCTNPFSQDAPLAVSDGYGGALVVWRDDRNASTTFDIYAQRIAAGLGIAVGWPVDGIPVTRAPEDQTNHDMVSDGNGGAFIVWMDARDVFVSRYDIYAQHVLANGTIAPGWPADGLPLCTAPSDQVLPKIATDGAGGAIVVWEDHRAGGLWGSDDGLGDLYAIRVQSDGTLAPGWSTGGNLICSAPGDQVSPAVVSDGSGGVIAAWSDGRNFAVTGGDVYTLRVTGAGTAAAGWPAQGLLLSALPGPQGAELHLVPDGTGGALVGWVDYASDPNGNIYADHVTASGAIAAGWPVNGLPVCAASRDQFNLQMISDGSGGALFSWDDYRDYSTTSADLFGQHVFGDGTLAPGWAADGNRLATGPGYQIESSLAPDGQGEC